MSLDAKPAHDLPPNPTLPVAAITSQSRLHLIWPSAIRFALFGWLIIVLVFGSLLIARSFGLAALGEPFPQSWAFLSPIGALVLVLISSLLAVITARLSPANTLRVLAVFSVSVLIIAATTTNNLLSLLVACCLNIAAGTVGFAIIRFAPLRNIPLAGAAAVAIALGYTILGIVSFFLALVGGLRFWSVLIVGGILFLLSLFSLRHLHRWSPRFLKPSTSRSGTDALCIGATFGALTFALLAAFTPENMFDPFRQHLPIAVEFWNSGSAAAIPHLGVSRDPVLAHLLFAISFGIGGLSAATLVHSSMGLIATLGVIGGASLIGGQRAGILAGVTFATMPLLLWELGHAYTDLFPAAFTAAAVVCVLVWIGENRPALLLLAGVLCGAGVSAKLTMVWVSLAIALALLVIGDRSRPLSNRILSASIFAVGHVIAIPWLARTFVVSGGVPGKISQIVGFVLEFVPGISYSVVPPVDPGFQAVDVSNAGIGHAVLDVVRVPWLLTFFSDRYSDVTLGGGDIGLLLPLLLPTALLARRDRRWWFLAIVSIVMYLAWWVTPQQVSRHLLPTLVSLAMLCGVGATSLTRFSPNWGIAPQTLMRLCLVLCLMGSIILLANGRYSQVPVDVILKRVSATEYIDQVIPAARELRIASDSLPPGAPLLYVGKRGGAQLYSNANLVNSGQFTQELLDSQFGATDDSVLAKLADLNTSGILWDRSVTKPEDWTSHLLSLEFLSRHTRVLAASEGYLLFELDTSGGSNWNVEPATTLIKDPSFKSVKPKTSAWTSDSRISRTDGGIAPRRDAIVSQKIPVNAGTPYLMVANVACPDLWSRTTLSLRWFDADGSEISQDSQVIFAGSELNDQFLWAVAPEGAATANVGFVGQSRCVYSRVDVFAQPTPG